MKLKLDTKTVTALALAKGRNEDFAWDTELENFGLRLRRKAEGVRRTLCRAVSLARPQSPPHARLGDQADIGASARRGEKDFGKDYARRS